VRNSCTQSARLPQASGRSRADHHDRGRRHRRGGGPVRARDPQPRHRRGVMRHLRRIDQVAYVRFASVYKEFRDVSEFMTRSTTSESPRNDLQRRPSPSPFHQRALRRLTGNDLYLAQQSSRRSPRVSRRRKRAAIRPAFTAAAGRLLEQLMGGQQDHGFFHWDAAESATAATPLLPASTCWPASRTWRAFAKRLCS